MEKLSQYQKNLLEYIYQNFVQCSRKGEAFLTNEDNIIYRVKNEYDNFAKNKSIQKVLSIIKDIISTDGFKFYENHLQLNDNHTMWDINASIETEEYWELVSNYMDLFEEKTNVKLYLLGRMNRHAVVENTIENFLNYSELRGQQMYFEKKLVDYINTHY